MAKSYTARGPAWDLFSPAPTKAHPLGAAGARRLSSAEEGEGAARRPMRGRSSSPARSIVARFMPVHVHKGYTFRNARPRRRRIDYHAGLGGQALRAQEHGRRLFLLVP